MKLFLQKMIKASACVMIFYVLQALLFGRIYSSFSELSYSEILICELAGAKGYSVQMNLFVASMITVQNVLYAVVIAVFASYAYASYLYRPLPILFPPKLVIRRRSNGKLCFGVLIGNKHREPLYDLECTMTCRFLKPNGKMNSEHKVKDNHTIIQNYHRFSFEIKNLPKEIMEAYINKNSESWERNEIIITLSGIGYANNKFYIKKTYKLSQIVMDEHDPKPEEETRNPFNNKVIRTKINWKELYREIEVGEERRHQIVEEIKSLLDIK